MGYTGTSRGSLAGNKGKSPSHLHISFPTKKQPPMIFCILFNRQAGTSMKHL